MAQDYWKQTADAFTSLIERPKMVEKLLLRPPFKYIFDIIGETTRVTNWATGLFQGEELSADYYNDKDRKIMYLQRVIKLVELMLGVTVEAKPQKIAAGQEPELTNLLLQQIHQCATSGKPSDPFVKKVLNPNAEEDPKPKAVRPPSAARKKAPEAQQPPAKESTQQITSQQKTSAASKKEVAIEQQQQQQQPPVEKKKTQAQPTQQSSQEQYSEKVKELERQTAEQENAQKVIEKEEEQVQQQTNEKENINFGRLGNKKKGEKVISTSSEITEKDLEAVQSTIQSICQNTAPLSKSIEFITDDIESMNKELVFWRKQYNASKVKMQNELKITEETLMPVYDKIAEVEDEINDFKVKIQTMKAQIIKNDSTFRDLLMSVLTTK